MTDPTGAELDALLDERIRDIIATAIAALSPQDYAARVAHCRRTGLHGCTMLSRGEEREIIWGGRTLAVVGAGVFSAAGLADPAGVTYARLPAAPDDVSELTDP